MQQWEYKCLRLASITGPSPDPEKSTVLLEEELNALGEEGWELMDLRYQSEWIGDLILFLKRPSSLVHTKE